MKKFVFAAALVVALGALHADPATAQGCAGGMCALPPGAADGQQQQQQQAAPGAPMTGGMGMMGMGMCPCCRQMAMMQPSPQGGLQPMPGSPGMGGDMGMGSTPRPPAGSETAPGATPPAQ
jgi:hypothetical protein